jgi:Ca2+-binding RTX toxin-like protein
MRHTATPVALMAAIVLALLTAGAVLAHHVVDYTEITGATRDDDTLRGTSGNDYWEGSEGDDTIYGKDGYDLIGRARFLAQDWGVTDDNGADTYDGGPGKDILESSGDGSVDTIDCGAGAEDLASFDKGTATSPQTTVSDEVNTETCERLDWTNEELADCAVKPWDNADVKCKTGTKRADNLLGNDSPDIRIVDAMWGEGGGDTLRGRRGFDGLEGGPGKDALYGGPGDDALYGDGHDQAGGFDQSGQFTGNDKHIDKLYGGAGDDRIDAADVDAPGTDAQKPDTISCGGGDHDFALIDVGIDVDPKGVTLKKGQAGCEIVASSPPTFKSWWWGPKKKGKRGKH